MASSQQINDGDEHVRKIEMDEMILISGEHFKKVEPPTVQAATNSGSVNSLSTRPNYATFESQTSESDITNNDADDSDEESNGSDLASTNIPTTRSMSYTFNGSYLTHSLIQPELESYFKTSSKWYSGILIMANVCLGMGILNFPRIVYETGGILLTSIFLFTYVLILIGSMYVIAYSCRYFGSTNYQNMVQTLCGTTIGIICMILMFMEITGSLIVKLVVLQDQLDRIYSLITKEPFTKHWYLMPIVSTLLLPFCAIRNFSIFKYFSIFGIFAASYIAIAVGALGYYMHGQAKPADFIPSTDSPRNLFLVFPLLIYGYHGHIEAPLVFSNLKRHKIRNFMKTVISYTFIATACYLITAIYGYLTFGKNLDADILLNYPHDNWYANVASIIIILKLFTSFPVLFFVNRSVFSMFYYQFTRLFPDSIRRYLEHYDIARIIQTIFVFYLIVLLALLIPNISQAISLIGAISCHFSFTFPGLCFFNLYRDATLATDQRKHVIRKYIGMFYIVLGFLFFGMNLTVAIQNLMSGTANPV